MEVFVWGDDTIVIKQSNGLPECITFNVHCIVLALSNTSLPSTVSCIIFIETLELSTVSPSVWKFIAIIPSAVHDSQLRKVLSELLVIYTICHVSSTVPSKVLPEKQRMDLYC